MAFNHAFDDGLWGCTGEPFNSFSVAKQYQSGQTADIVFIHYAFVLINNKFNYFYLAGNYFCNILEYRFHGLAMAAFLTPEIYQYG